MNFRHKKPEELDVNITPLVDVVFLLLIFFMLTASFVETPQALTVALPKTVTAQESSSGDLVVTVTEDDTIWVGEQIVAKEHLVGTLSKAIKKKHLSVKGDRGARLGILRESDSFRGAAREDAGLCRVSTNHRVQHCEDIVEAYLPKHRKYYDCSRYPAAWNCDHSSRLFELPRDGGLTSYTGMGTDGG